MLTVNQMNQVPESPTSKFADYVPDELIEESTVPVEHPSAAPSSVTTDTSPRKRQRHTLACRQIQSISAYTSSAYISPSPPVVVSPCLRIEYISVFNMIDHVIVDGIESIDYVEDFQDSVLSLVSLKELSGQLLHIDQPMMPEDQWHEYMRTFVLPAVRELIKNWAGTETFYVPNPVTRFFFGARESNAYPGVLYGSLDQRAVRDKWREKCKTMTTEEKSRDTVAILEEYKGPVMLITYVD